MAKAKHPREMTNEEAIKHLFHPDVVQQIKGILKDVDKSIVTNPKPKKKKATKR